MNEIGFSRWLAHQLLRREWTQADFARRMDISTATISRWMNGERVPAPPSCDRIADVLNVDLDLVLTLAGHRPAIEAIDPDDPRERIVGLVRRVQWDDDRLAVIEAVMRGWIDRDRRKGKR